MWPSNRSVLLMVTVVFDTVVFVRSLINPHSVCGKLVFAHAASYRLVLSRPLIEEIMEVLTRPELTKKLPTLASIDMQTVLNIVGHVSVVEVSDIPPVSRDPNDDKCLATALAAQANYLVSEDKDLLVLKEYEGMKIVDSKTFLAILKN